MYLLQLDEFPLLLQFFFQLEVPVEMLLDRPGFPFPMIMRIS